MRFRGFFLLTTFLLLVAHGSGCSSEPAASSRTLPIVHFPDEGDWLCQLQDREIIFHDADNDGLAESATVRSAPNLWVREVFYRRDYCGFEPVAGGLVPEKVAGVSFVLPPMLPMDNDPISTERLTRPDSIERLCGWLNRFTYRWGGNFQKYPDGAALSGIGRDTPLPPWMQIRIWFKGDEEPLVILVHHLDGSYDLHDDGLEARWRGKEWWFCNDALAYMLMGNHALCPARVLDRKGEWVPVYGSCRFYKFYEPGKDWTRPMFGMPAVPVQDPTFFGGIPVNWDGKPTKKVTTDERLKEVRALIGAYHLDTMKLEEP